MLFALLQTQFGMMAVIVTVFSLSVFAAFFFRFDFVSDTHDLKTPGVGAVPSSGPAGSASGVDTMEEDMEDNYHVALGHSHNR